MSICMPSVPGRYDLNSYPSFKPYVSTLQFAAVRLLSAEICSFGRITVTVGELRPQPKGSYGRLLRPKD